MQERKYRVSTGWCVRHAGRAPSADFEPISCVLGSLVCRDQTGLITSDATRLEWVILFRPEFVLSVSIVLAIQTWWLIWKGFGSTR